MGKNNIGKNNSFKNKVKGFAATIGTDDEDTNYILAENGDVITTEAGEELTIES